VPDTTKKNNIISIFVLFYKKNDAYKKLNFYYLYKNIWKYRKYCRKYRFFIM